MKNNPTYEELLSKILQLEELLKEQTAELQQEITEHKKTGEALGESEIKFCTLVEHLPAINYTAALDEFSTTLYVSKQIEKILGISPEEYKADPSFWLKHLYNEDRVHVLEDVKYAHENNRPFISEYRMTSTDGRIVWIKDEAVIVKDEKGNPLYLQGIMFDISEQKQAERRIKHLNLVLRAIRNVNLLITKEKDRDSLIKGTCENLIETRGYFNVWIALLDDSGKYLTSAESGLGKDLLPIIELMKSGKITACGKNALKKSDVVITETPPVECKDCPLSGKYTGRGAMTIRLEYEGKIYGLTTVSIPKELIKDEEEHNLLKEVAGDIAFALHGIEVEKERKQADEKLRTTNQQLEVSNQKLIASEQKIKKNAHDLDKRVKELSCIYGISESIRTRETIKEILQDTANIIPPSWHYPEITRGKVRFDGKEYVSQAFKESKWKQTADIIVNGKVKGSIEVYCIEKCTELDEGPFMKEERNLINDIAKTISEAIEHKQVQEALIKSEEKYRSLIEIIEEGIGLVDKNEMFTFVNQAAADILGFTKDEMIGKNLKEFTTPEMYQQVL
ncbi:MAG: PAS domain S-box protein, partial [Bacteroidales bacterium]|nr:PAS domain S-box protein [Bacteroidales bacterium]